VSDLIDFRIIKESADPGAQWEQQLKPGLAKSNEGTKGMCANRKLVEDDHGMIAREEKTIGRRSKEFTFERLHFHPARNNAFLD
jgi:hypothetical protein